MPCANTDQFKLFHINLFNKNLVEKYIKKEGGQVVMRNRYCAECEMQKKKNYECD